MFVKKFFAVFVILMALIKQFNKNTLFFARVLPIPPEKATSLQVKIGTACLKAVRR